MGKLSHRLPEVFSSSYRLAGWTQGKGREQLSVNTCRKTALWAGFPRDAHLCARGWTGVGLPGEQPFG